MARNAAMHHGSLLKPAGAAGDGLASPLADPSSTSSTTDVKEELGIPSGLQAIAPIIVGVPRGEARVVPRKAAVVFNWIR